MLRDSILLLLKAKARAAVGQQVGLFGSSAFAPAAAPAPRPAPPPPAPEPRGPDVVNVRTHLRTTSHGVEVVHAHQAHVVHGQAEKPNHPRQPEPTPRDADPQQTVETFRLAVGGLQKTYRHLFENPHADMGAIREASAAFGKAAGPLLALQLPRFHRADEAKRLEKLTTAIQALRGIHDAATADSAVSRADPEVVARLQFDRVWRLCNSVRQQAGHVADLLSRPMEIKHGPFVLVNRHGFRAEEIQPSVEVLDKAASIAAAVGFGGVNRGRVLLVGKLKNGDVVHNTFAGRYSHDKDTVELNVEAKHRFDAVHTIVHELGHRAWYKLMTEAERNEWIEHYENSAQRPVRAAERERLWGFWRDSGYDLRRAVKLAGSDGDLLRNYLKGHGSNTVPAPERHITEDMVRRWFVRPDEGAWFGPLDGARSVSAYGATNPKEDFAEVFADWAQRREALRDDYPPPLMGRIRLLERVRHRLATTTAHE